MSSQESPQYQDIVQAARRLQGRVHRTPLLSFSSGARPDRRSALWLKCENLQKTGAFKARGALHYLLRRGDLASDRGVTTYSSGNHAGAVAWAAAQLGLAAKVFVPVDIPDSKAAAVAGYGAELIRVGTTSLERKQAAEQAAAEEGLHIVPPFDHPWIIAGQGTAGLEIAEDCQEVQRVLVPVGGGGLLAGVALALSEAVTTDVEVIGVEPEAAASMSAALNNGAPCAIEVGNTIADGLKPVQVGKLNHQLVTAHVDRVVTVSDSWIAESMKLLLERGKLLVEPSGAAALAAYRHHPELESHANTVVVLSGGNVDLNRFREVCGDLPGVSGR